MQYKKLGRTGLKISRISLGTMTLGTQVGEAEAVNIIKSAMTAGINCFDTAGGYGGGKAEGIIARALKGERHSAVIATKLGADPVPRPIGSGLSRKDVMRGIEDSLSRLQTDYVDIYYCHMPDYDTPIEETLRALDDLVHQGKVRYIGCSNFTAWQLGKSLWVSDLHNLARFDSIEPPYNLLTRDVEVELLPLCASEGVGVCVYNPLGGELLTDRHEFGKPPAEGRFTLSDIGPRYRERYWSSINFEAVGRLRQIAKEHGCSMAQFALAWIFQNETITSAISGTTSLEQLKENMSALEITLSPEELQACDDIWAMFRPARYHYARDGRIRKD